jgi:hypothetical protein
MKSIRVLTVVSLGLLTGFLANPLKADDFNKETIVKIDNPMQVGNVVLPPGKYDFQLAQTQTAQNVVYIRDASDYHLVATVLGDSAYRLYPHGKPGWVFYPSQPGQVAALKTWYFAGENAGVQFRDYKAPAATLARNPSSTSTGAVGGMK